MKIRILLAMGVLWVNLSWCAEEKEDSKEIPLSELPEVIKQDIASKYPGYKIKEAEIKDSNGAITYEVEIKKFFKEIDLIYDSDGTLRGKEGKDDDGDDKKGEDDD